METIGFTSEDILDLAILMENTGAEFYRRAAVKTTDEAHRNTLTRLSMMEETHAEMFIRIKSEISDKSDPIDHEVEETIVAFLGSWLKGEVFEKDPSRALNLSENASLSDVYNAAIGMEKESIAYYSALLKYVADDDTRQIIHRIIHEEYGHVVDLGEISRRLD